MKPINIKLRTEHIIDVALELVLLIAPVFIYVLLEAMHKDDYYFLLLSPEWSICTIFISTQAILILNKANTKKTKVNNQMFGLIIALCIFITIFASLNTYTALHKLEPVILSMDFFIRLILFILSMVLFIAVAIPQKLMSEEYND
jgi:drug/metabolite transporter (DMT)-like permease